MKTDPPCNSISFKFSFNIWEYMVGEPVNPCGRRVHNCCPFHVKANKGWLSSSMGILKNAAVKSITVKHLAQRGIYKSGIEGSGTMGCGMITYWLIALKSLTNQNSGTPYLSSLFFLTGNTGVLYRDSHSFKIPWARYCSIWF